jgi:drug/metabolite transporter (DMT)-like permease
VAALLALISSAMWGSGDYIAGRLTRSWNVLLVLGATQAVGLVVMVAVASATGSWGAAPDYLTWAVLASVAGAAGLALYYLALAIGTMGIVSPIAALGAVVPVLVGVSDGERPTALQALGIAVALAGVVLASGPEVHGDAGWRPVALAAGAAGLLGLALVAIARGSQSSVIMTMTAMRIVTVTLISLALLAVGSRLRRPSGAVRTHLWAFGAVGILDVGANLAFGAATTRGLLSLVSVFGSLYPVATILLARWLDGERLRGVQSVGVGLALVGVAAINVG